MADDTKDTSAEGLAAELEALLTGSKDADASDGKDESTEDETDEQDSTEESEEESEQEASEEEESDEEESEEEEEEADDAPKIVPEKTVVFTVSDGDKEIPVDAGEAKAGYLRQQDYSKKTAETAEEKKATQAERAALSEALGRVLTALDGTDADATPEKLAELARTDPEKALQLKFEKDARDGQRAAIEKAKKALDEKTQKEQAAEIETIRAAEFARLVDVFPDMKDPAKAKPILMRMTEAAVAVGFAAEDMNRITDHRLMKLLDLAATGLRLTKTPLPKPDKKGKKGPVITPGFRKTGGSRKMALEAEQRFQKDRSVDAAVDSLAAEIRAAKRK